MASKLEPDIDSLNRVFACVEEERLRQNMLHGTQKHPDKKWLTILMEEVGEVATECIDDKVDTCRLRDELVQVAAVAFAWIEQLNNGDL